ncbi:regulatory LuxR family protein [Pseudonocardia hierapolitana]|uniref:Regulatory LuxR family protein n=1 Tax=Pseudonocardia hierapolitana TaxID=1128676 RepID=A0A561SJM9_9PSEU|nr:LuxR family transcriptional regulator [Pseudonocardia hierapolitana]TWF75098.1 regulatory LuxR family protein [Pseudonocardia hierapolitana]
MRELLCPVLVGRDQEWQELRPALDRLADGLGATRVVAGEAGVGKSRLLREVAEEAGRRGARVLTGRAVERDSPLPFRPVAEALFSHLRRSGPPRVRELAPFLPILGRLVPEWRLPGESAGEESLVVLGEAVLRLLAALGRDGGCVLVLEDLHWADAETVEVVEYLADNIAGEPVLCVVSLRSDEPSRARSRVHDLASRRSATVVELRSLTDDEVVSVAAGCLHAPVVPRGVAEVVVARADGLPFLVEELLAAMVQAHELYETADGWVLDRSPGLAIPATFAETVQRRVGASPDLRGLLVAAALLGRSFDWRLLGAISGRDEAAVVDHLHRAVDAQLLSVEAADPGHRFRFRHALTRDAILAELLPPERATLAARGLRAVEAAHPGLPGEWCELAAELAEQADEPSRAAGLHLESGRRAFGRGALASAEANLERARRLVGDNRQLAVEIDEALCEVLVKAGNAERVDEVGRRLLPRLAALAASPARRAQVHLWLARTAIVSADWARALDRLHDARELAASGGVGVGEFEVLAAQVALGEGRLDDAVALAERALTTAGSGRRYELACEALAVLGQRERLRDLASAARAFAAVLALAEQHGLVLWRVRALHELGTIDLLGGGPLDRLAQARKAALDVGALATAATLSLQMAAWFTNHAEPEGVLDAGRSCAAEARRLRLPLVEGLGFVLQAVAHALRDQWAEMEAAIDEAVVVSGGHPEVRGVALLMARALLWIIRDDRARALAELDAGMELLRGTPVTAPCRGLWALVHALDAGDGEAAVAEVEASGLTTYWLIRGWVGHARAVTLGRRGQAAEAEEAFVRADADLAPCDWYRHHARRLVAEAAIADGWGDPTRWLADALAFFDPSGPPAVASACRSLLRQAGAPVPRRRRPAPDLPATMATVGVTPREAEVLAFLAEGRSTREIAARLYLSPKTVERHIANLAAKVGVGGRSELVAYAARHHVGTG